MKFKELLEKWYNNDRELAIKELGVNMKYLRVMISRNCDLVQLADGSWMNKTDHNKVFNPPQNV